MFVELAFIMVMGKFRARLMQKIVRPAVHLFFSLRFQLSGPLCCAFPTLHKTSLNVGLSKSLRPCRRFL